MGSTQLLKHFPLLLLQRRLSMNKVMKKAPSWSPVFGRGHECHRQACFPKCLNFAYQWETRVSASALCWLLWGKAQNPSSSDTSVVTINEHAGISTPPKLSTMEYIRSGTIYKLHAIQPAVTALEEPTRETGKGPSLRTVYGVSVPSPGFQLLGYITFS